MKYLEQHYHMIQMNIMLNKQLIKQMKIIIHLK